MKSNDQRKSLWKFLRVILRKILRFEKALYLTKIDQKVEGNTITRQNQVIETKTEIFDFKTTRVQLPESSIMQVQHQMVNTSFAIQKEVPVTSNSELVPLIKIATLEHVHPIIRKHSKCTISRTNILLHSSLGRNYSGSRNIIYCKGIRNLVCKSPISGENTNLNKNVKRAIFISGTESFGNVGERSYPKSSTHKRAISEQPLTCRKKGWREPPSDKF